MLPSVSHFFPLIKIYSGLKVKIYPFIVCNIITGAVKEKKAGWRLQKRKDRQPRAANSPRFRPAPDGRGPAP